MAKQIQIIGAGLPGMTAAVVNVKCRDAIHRVRKAT